MEETNADFVILRAHDVPVDDRATTRTLTVERFRIAEEGGADPYRASTTRTVFLDAPTLPFEVRRAVAAMKLPERPARSYELDALREAGAMPGHARVTVAEANLRFVDGPQAAGWISDDTRTLLDYRLKLSSVGDMFERVPAALVGILVMWLSYGLISGLLFLRPWLFVADTVYLFGGVLAMRYAVRRAARPASVASRRVQTDLE